MNTKLLILAFTILICSVNCKQNISNIDTFIIYDIAPSADSITYSDSKLNTYNHYSFTRSEITELYSIMNSCPYVSDLWIWEGGYLGRIKYQDGTVMSIYMGTWNRLFVLCNAGKCDINGYYEISSELNTLWKYLIKKSVVAMKKM